MPSTSTESTPRERLARLLTLLARTRMFHRSALGIAGLGLGVALLVALQTKRIYRSETTVLYRDGMAPAAAETESPAQRAARLGPKLKDLLYARPNLEEVIRQRDLFPEKTSRSMLDGIEEMALAIGFRARASDSYVVSFSYEDPAVAQAVAAQLAERMIDEYNRQNLDTATLTRNFLRRKLDEATSRADDASRALATFLAEHPQFQWGGADSPYAPTPALPSAPAARAPLPRTPAGPADPHLRALERDLARVESELLPPPAAGAAGPVAPTTVADAQRQREAAAAALATAEATLAEKLTTLTPAHPDAVSARAHAAAARQALAAAESALARARVGAVPVEGAARADLRPERRAALERERALLRRQLEARRTAGGPLPEVRAAPGVAASGATAPGATTVVELETEWHRLRLALDRARTELGTIQQNARAADLSADAVAKQGHEEMQILEPAYLPMRPDRGRGRVFFTGATIALFLALGYAAARVLLNDTLLDEGDVLALGGPEVLVTMPHLPEPRPRPVERAIVPAIRPADAADGDDLDPPAVITPSPGAPLSRSSGLVLRDDPRAIVEAVFDDPEVEVMGVDVDPGAPARVLAAAPPAVLGALRVLRHRLEQRRGHGPFVLSVMSPTGAEGKTTLALRLALTLSEAERARVILVEGNFERPRLAAELGLRLPPEASFSRQIRERMSGRGIPWGVVRLGPSLSLLAEPDSVAAHPEAYHSTHFEAAFSALRRSYEYVIVDGPAIVGSGDANVLEGVSDGVLVVVRAAATRGAALTRAMQQLGSMRVVGAVLNDVG
jgi:Mrp family chromosome partitioning ATPase